MFAAEMKFDFSAGLALADGLKKEAGRRLADAVAFLERKCYEAVSVPNPPVKVRGRVTYPTPSRPGEPPRRRSGWGRRMIDSEVDRDKLTGRIFVHRAAMYMAVLDRGNFRIAARPWLLAAVQQNLREFARLALPEGGGP